LLLQMGGKNGNEKQDTYSVLYPENSFKNIRY
jgi:hypothetical protein